MTDFLRLFRAMADATRLRLLALLEKEELSVHELQEITGLAQSRISTHLGLLQNAGLLQSRRAGRRVFYRLSPDAAGPARELIAQGLQGARQFPEHASDQAGLRRVLVRRHDQAQLFFDQVAGRFDRSYGPGRSWQAFGQLLLRMLPPLVVADLGSGEGLVSELLAKRCKRVIAVDNSEKIVAFGAAKARKNGLKNLEFRLGDLQDPPIEDASVDVVILSQALHHAENPLRAICSAHRILKPGGYVLVLDLLRHEFASAQELYGDKWPGFSQGELQNWLETAGFRQIEVAIVAREEHPPHFQTVLAAGEKPAEKTSASSAKRGLRGNSEPSVPITARSAQRSSAK
ncbi:MAG TPA: metalloregulator ArsR/SmtB family transcription factor [Verrucomicrobiota bacterium]|nr:metalloregulator ArsR/SmtB family transcription factor [Verrucomicrobiota bacterium]